MGSELQDIVVLLGLLITIVVGAWYVVRRGRLAHDARRRRAEMMDRLVEKFDSPDDMLAFARSPEGQQLLSATDPPATSQRRVLLLFQSGVVLTVVGIALLLNGARMDPVINGAGDVAAANWWGILSLCLGLGLLIIGLITYHFGKQWGLLNSGRRDGDPPV